MKCIFIQTRSYSGKVCVYKPITKSFVVYWIAQEIVHNYMTEKVLEGINTKLINPHSASEHSFQTLDLIWQIQQ